MYHMLDLNIFQRISTTQNKFNDHNVLKLWMNNTNKMQVHAVYKVRSKKVEKYNMRTLTKWQLEQLY